MGAILLIFEKDIYPSLFQTSWKKGRYTFFSPQNLFHLLKMKLSRTKKFKGFELKGKKLKLVEVEPGVLMQEEKLQVAPPKASFSPNRNKVI